MIRCPAVMGRGIACGSFCVRWLPAAHLGGPAGALNRSSGYMKRLRRRAPRGRPAVPTQIKISLRGGPGFDRTLEVHAAHAHDHAYFVRRIAVCEPPRACFWSRDHPPRAPALISTGWGRRHAGELILRFWVRYLSRVVSPPNTSLNNPQPLLEHP